MSESGTVAVIGLGALGLVAVKNLVEEGFNVTGFDRNDYIGGLWKFTEDDKASVMQSTITNISKERGCFTDFPFPKHVPTHPRAADVQQYLEDYAKHFNLGPCLRLNTNVKHISFDEERQKWIIEIDGMTREAFDKLIVSTGANNIPNVPIIEGLEKFMGDCIHSRAFKRPAEFKDKRVMVVGFANTAADTSTQLVDNASKIYLSHRRGNYIIPRIIGGRSSDHSLTYRLALLQEYLSYYFPSAAENMMNTFVKKLQDKCFTIRPEWGFHPAPSLKQSILICSDDLIARLEDGSIESVPSIRRVVGGKDVELEDGRIVQVDTIILCTGYKPDLSILDSKYDPTLLTTQEWATAEGSNGKPLPRLYQNIFSLQKPESLAFLGCVAFPFPAFQVYDMATMAIAQVWKGTSSLPPRVQMEAEVDEHHKWVCSLAHRGSVYPGIVKPGPWMRWANQAAGTGVNEYLGYGATGWKFWLKERQFCNTLMRGIYSPHLMRLFEGKRKKWDGARMAIMQANEGLKDSGN